MEWYEKLHADKNARIVRNLCMIRTALELNYGNRLHQKDFPEGNISE